MVQFLASADPEVLCIRGRWGSGKTFAWRDVLATQKDHAALKRYSYVSLFGIDSLEGVKSAIFENTVNIEDVEIKPSIATFGNNIGAVGGQLGRKSLKYIFQNSYTGKYVGGLQAATFLFVSETIVCIDDLERRGKNLSLRDVLGLVSFLKTERRCKVVLILNNEKFADEDKADFDSYLEKVVDASIEFAPTPAECAAIAIVGNDEVHAAMRRHCAALGVSNIRIIKQIERLAKIVIPKLSTFDATVREQALQSLVLLSWSKHTDDGPSIEFIRDKRGKSLYGLTKPNSMSDQEKQWDSLLDKFGFGRMDEFDLEILNGIERGYFDDEAIASRAKILDDAKKAADIEGSFSSAWRLYHDSFANNEPEVIAAIEASFVKAVKQITPVNLNGTVKLFKDLGYDERAKRLIKTYVDQRKDENGLFNLTDYPFAADIDDEDVLAAFNDRVADVIDDRDPGQVLLHMAKNSGWGFEDIELLSRLSASDYVAIFKAAGGNKDRIIGACLLFNRLGGADEKQKAIGANALLALKIIGRESEINRRRVAKYGIEITDEEMSAS
jgi:hypothetical protein